MNIYNQIHDLESVLLMFREDSLTITAKDLSASTLAFILVGKEELK